MRLLTAHLPRESVARPAVLVDGRVVPVAALQRTGQPGTELDGWIAVQDLRGLLAADPDLAAVRRALDGVLGRDPARLAAWPSLEDVRIAAPLPTAGKVVCIGLNYRDHIVEQHIPMPDRPTLFSKFANAIVADGEPVIRHAATHALDLEAELAVVVGRRASRVPASDALLYVAGYTVVNDVTARDLQGQRQALRAGEHGDGQWLRAKGSDTFLPMGPVLVTADEIADPGDLAVRSWRTPATGSGAGREVPMQDGTTSDMLFDVAHLVEFVSATISLEPGDVIATGTPAGVGVFRDPPVFPEPGDVMRVEVEGIGSLANPVADWDGTIPEGSPAARLRADRRRRGLTRPSRDTMGRSSASTQEAGT